MLAKRLMLDRLARVLVVVGVTGCNMDGAPRPTAKVDASDEEATPPTASVVVSVGARDGRPADRFTAKEAVFFTAFADSPLGNVDDARDYFFRVVDRRGEDVSRSDAACRRVRIGTSGRIDVYYANGDDACPHSSAADLTNRQGGVTVGLAPFGDADAILDGVARYELQLAPVDRFTGFHEPAFSASFELDLRVASK